MSTIIVVNIITLQAPRMSRVEELTSGPKRNVYIIKPEPLQSTPPKIQRIISEMSEGTPKDMDSKRRSEGHMKMRLRSRRSRPSSLPTMCTMDKSEKPTCCVVVYVYNICIFSSNWHFPLKT